MDWMEMLNKVLIYYIFIVLYCYLESGCHIDLLYWIRLKCYSTRFIGNAWQCFRSVRTLLQSGPICKWITSFTSLLPLAISMSLIYYNKLVGFNVMLVEGALLGLFFISVVVYGTVPEDIASFLALLESDSICLIFCAFHPLFILQFATISVYFVSLKIFYLVSLTVFFETMKYIMYFSLQMRSEGFHHNMYDRMNHANIQLENTAVAHNSIPWGLLNQEFAAQMAGAAAEIIQLQADSEGIEAVPPAV